MTTSTAHFSSLDLCPQLSAAQPDAERGSNLDVEHCCLPAQAGEEEQPASPRAGQLTVLLTDRCVVGTTDSTMWQIEGTMLYPRAQKCCKFSALELIGTSEM